MNFKINWKAIILFLSIIGPGIITANVDNDAGGITTFTIAGARFGYDILWALVPITVLLIIAQEMCARMGVVTGKGLADLIRENFGVKWTMLIMIGLIFANFATTTAEFAGIAAVAGILGLSKYIVVIGCALVALGMLVYFNYRKIEKVFLVMSFFYIAYVFSAFLAKPDWGLAISKTIVPTIHLNSSYILLLVALIGTNITPWMQFFLQGAIVEKGIRLKDYNMSKWDVIIGCIITDVITFFVIVACAATLFKAGIPVNEVSEAALALKPLAGKYASALFAFGFFNAAFFGACIIPISTAYYVCEGLGFEKGISKKFKEAPQFYVILSSMLLLGAAIILIPNLPLVTLLIAAQVINGVLIPFILIAILVLINNKKIMGEHVNSRVYNIFAWAGSIAVILVTLLLIATTIFPNLF